MDFVLHEDETFEKIIYTGQQARGQAYLDCVFIKCDFSDSDFDHNRFTDCRFEGCNFSTIKLRGTTVSNAVFKDCKIIGVNFSECDDFLFSASFTSCTLDYSAFVGKKMAKTSFLKTSLKEVNFTQTNLTGSIFNETDLAGALFDDTNLSAANLVTAYNYVIDPELNIIKKASFSMDGLPGLLMKHGIKVV